MNVVSKFFWSKSEHGGYDLDSNPQHAFGARADRRNRLALVGNAMMRIVKNYDPKSYELAEAFLSDEPHLNTERRRDALAQLIQSVIEDFIEEEQANFVPVIMRAP